MLRSLGLAFALTVFLSGCSIREGRIAMSPHLAASTERLELRGMGAGTRGDFELEGAFGTFTRSAERLGIFDALLVQHSGGGSFELGRTPQNAALAGRCSYREGVVNLGPITVTPHQLAFHCEFSREGRPIEAGLLLEDPQGTFGTVHGRSERWGTLFFEGQQIEIRSIHHDEGGGIPSPTALGYVLVGENGEIGAVDLNGLNKTIFVPTAGEQREAVLAAALALSIFWDPAEVQPES